MSSDGFFSDDLDSAFLDEADAIEAAHVSPPKPKPVAAAPPPVINIDDSDDYDVSYNFDETDFQQLDNVEESAYTGGPSNNPGLRRTDLGRTPSMTVQRDLFGNLVTPGASTSKPAHAHKQAQPAMRTMSHGGFGGAQKKIKFWDHTHYAKSGWKKRKPSKGKDRAYGEDGGDEEGDEEEIERLPAPFISGPMKLQPDPLAMKHWIYPLNKSKRDYQFNIVKHSLFENTLVALPTGLGKTFIAGVVMLNFYNWFPEGKVIFVAPTKPLVAQQIQACHKVCGIPGSDATELTGETPVATRGRLWESKRVFYLTPQTLINDLTKNTCDPKSIVLLVIDEAHKGTGDYAYAQVVRYMMAMNPHFRVLALTATPGGNPEAVQALIDSLHISRIEIRNEDSLDLKPYLHKKIMKQHTIIMTESIIKVQDMLAKLMEPKLKRLQQDGLLRGAEAARMHPYRPQAEMGNIQKRPDKQRLAYAYTMLKSLGSLARAMGYLLESSVGMCYTSLKQLADGVNEDAKTKKVSAGGKVAAPSAAKLKEVEELRGVLREIDVQRGKSGALPLHPKMVELKNLIIQHFGALADDQPVSGEDGEEGEGGEARAAAKKSRVMVFAAFREVVDEIVDVLNQEQPLIRAIKLIGQGADKQGNAGLNQKAQQGVLDRFKAGEGNVLVATSIGEEGLDIGEIDMVICYDAQKTPIRMLQRVGRTGRKQDGYVHILMAEGREDDNWNKSKEAYENVQRSIVQADQLELYADVPRLLPEHVKPIVHEQIMDIEEYSREASRKTSLAKAPKSKALKRKRDDNVGRNIPEGTPGGFTNVGAMLRNAGAKGKGKGKAKATTLVFDPHAAEDDDTDAEIEAGIFASIRPREGSTPSSRAKKPKRASASASAASTSKSAKDGKAKPASRKKKKAEYVEVDPPTFSQKARDDSDDEAIEAGLFPTTASRPTHPRTPQSSPIHASPQLPRARASLQLIRDRLSSPLLPPRASLRSPEWWPSTEAQLQGADGVIDLASPSSKSDGQLRSPDQLFMSSPERPVSLKRKRIVAASSPTTSLDETVPSRIGQSLKHSPSPERTGDVSWLLGDSDEEGVDIEITSSPAVARSPAADDDHELVEGAVFHLSSPIFSRAPHLLVADDSVEIVEDSFSPLSPLKVVATLLSSPVASPSRKRPRSGAMAPPALPARFTSAALLFEQELEDPEPSLPLRAAGRRRRKPAPVMTATDSSPLEMPPASQRQLQRLQRHRTSPTPSSPQPKKRSKGKRPVDLQALQHFVDAEAAHSGEELSEGSSGEDDPEDEYDRRFLHELPATQASPSYDQSLAYRQSLFTQAPGGLGPRFAGGPVRQGRFGPMKARPAVVLSSSPTRTEDDEPNEYVTGSFVVDDDADISYADDLSQL